MQIEIISEEGRFYSLEPVWNQLLQNSGANTVFLTFEWLCTWWCHFGTGKQLLIVAAKDGERVVGLAPLMIAPREGFRQLTMIGGNTVEYKDFIISNDTDREFVIGALVHSISRQKGWDCFKMDGFREDSSNFLPLKAVLARSKVSAPQWRETDVSPYVAIHQPWESYWAGIKRDNRAQIERTMRRLTRENGPVTYHQPKNLEEVDHYMEELIKLHLARRKGVKQTYSVFENPAMVSFYKDLARQLYAQEWLSMPVCMVNGEIVAILFGFEYAGRFFAYMAGLDQSCSKYGVGKSMHTCLIKGAFARGLKEYDFLMGNEPYKFDFNPTIRRLYSISFFQSSPAGHASRLWFGRVRPKLETWVNKNEHTEQLKWWFRRTRSGKA
jgi:CelD/BcsL family acetyltransferase involved in cellulose biosynthesis